MRTHKESESMHLNFHFCDVSLTGKITYCGGTLLKCCFTEAIVGAYASPTPRLCPMGSGRYSTDFGLAVR